MRRLHRQSRKQRLSLFGLAFVFLLQTLAWSGMPVYASDATEGWVVVCTNEGIKRISLSEAGIKQDESPPSSPIPALAEHCDLCVFAQGLGMAPPAPALLSLSTTGLIEIRIPASDPGVSSNSYSPQQPRAPPCLVPI